MILEIPTVDNMLSTLMDSGLGLDISKKSTGITVYENGVYETYQSVIEFDNESPLHFYHMVKALEEDLIELVDGKHFDIIAIEDVIESINFETLRDLILLNSVIDKLLAEGRVTCNYFSRINNSTWKKWLRTLRPVKKYENDKIEIEHTLTLLGHKLVGEYQHLSKTQKEKLGYQDQLDSTGLLIGAGLDRVNSGGTKLKRRERYELHVELYGSLEEVQNIYSRNELTVINLGGNLLSTTKDFFKNLEDEDKFKKYLLVVDSLGTLGLEYDIPDLENSKNFLILYQTIK